MLTHILIFGWVWPFSTSTGSQCLGLHLRKPPPKKSKNYKIPLPGPTLRKLGKKTTKYHSLSFLSLFGYSKGKEKHKKDKDYLSLPKTFKKTRSSLHRKIPNKKQGIPTKHKERKDRVVRIYRVIFHFPSLGVRDQGGEFCTLSQFSMSWGFPHLAKGKWSPNTMLAL